MPRSFMLTSRAPSRVRSSNAAPSHRPGTPGASNRDPGDHPGLVTRRRSLSGPGAAAPRNGDTLRASTRLRQVDIEQLPRELLVMTADLATWSVDTMDHQAMTHLHENLVRLGNASPRSPLRDALSTGQALRTERRITALPIDAMVRQLERIGPLEGMAMLGEALEAVLRGDVTAASLDLMQEANAAAFASRPVAIGDSVAWYAVGMLFGATLTGVCLAYKGLWDAAVIGRPPRESPGEIVPVVLAGAFTGAEVMAWHHHRNIAPDLLRRIVFPANAEDVFDNRAHTVAVRGDLADRVVERRRAAIAAVATMVDRVAAAQRGSVLAAMVDVPMGRPATVAVLREHVLPRLPGLVGNRSVPGTEIDRIAIAGLRHRRLPRDVARTLVEAIGTRPGALTALAITVAVPHLNALPQADREPRLRRWIAALMHADPAPPDWPPWKARACDLTAAATARIREALSIGHDWIWPPHDPPRDSGFLAVAPLLADARTRRLHDALIDPRDPVPSLVGWIDDSASVGEVLQIVESVSAWAGSGAQLATTLLRAADALATMSTRSTPADRLAGALALLEATQRHPDCLRTLWPARYRAGIHSTLCSLRFRDGMTETQSRTLFDALLARAASPEVHNQEGWYVLVHTTLIRHYHRSIFAADAPRLSADDLAYRDGNIRHFQRVLAAVETHLQRKLRITSTSEEAWQAVLAHVDRA